MVERGGGRHPLRHVTVADLLHPKILRDKAHDLSRGTVYTAAHRDLKAFVVTIVVVVVVVVVVISHVRKIDLMLPLNYASATSEF